MASPHTTPPPVTTAHAALVVGAVTAYAKAAKTHEAEAKRILAADYMAEGDRSTIRHPTTGAKLGTVSITEPTPVAEVDDEDAFFAHVVDTHGASAVVTEQTVATDRIDEVIDVLAQHAPHLLADPTGEVLPGTRKAILEQVAATGNLVPGVSVHSKRGHAVVRLEKGSLDVFRELVGAGVVDPLAELPAAAPKDGA